ncbi:MAG TPA: hypothetical protein DCS97_05640, partial [Planctomycetes bacterium]|nr:hypothetical protein [Planctomycetota bacterium]
MNRAVKDQTARPKAKSPPWGSRACSPRKAATRSSASRAGRARASSAKRCPAPARTASSTGSPEAAA